MEKPQTMYTIYTATDLDRESLITWKVPKPTRDRLITKAHIVALIELELANGNTRHAIKLLKEYLKGIDSSFDKDLIRLEYQVFDLEDGGEMVSAKNLHSADEIAPKDLIRTILAKIPEKGNSPDLSTLSMGTGEKSARLKTKGRKK